jgi:hemolysin III
MSQSRALGLPGAPAATKPLLRGYLHLGAAALTIFATLALLLLARGDPAKQVSLLVYGASAELLFALSALYHIGDWQPRTRALLRRLDHANIFVLITGTYTPIAFNVLAGGWRAGVLSAVWCLALAGVVIAAIALPLPRTVMVGLYIATGWVALAAIPQIAATTGLGGLLLLILGGLLYTAGALAYALKKPALWPRVFGYHELFHLATLVANAAFFAFMLAYVLPVARQ